MVGKRDIAPKKVEKPSAQPSKKADAKGRKEVVENKPQSKPASKLKQASLSKPKERYKSAELGILFGMLA